MAITFVNSATATTGGATSLAVNKPTNTADGDFLIATIHFRSNISNPNLSGWAYVRDVRYGTDPRAGIAVLVKIASGEGSTFTFSWTTSSQAIIICTAFRGVDVDWANSIMAHAARSGIGSSPHPTSQLVFQSCDYMAYAVITKDTTGGTFNNPGGWTQAAQTTSANMRACGVYLSVAATEGLAATSWTSNAGANTCTYTLALRAAGNTALSLKSFYGYTGQNTTQTMAMGAYYGERAAGDLMVAVMASFINSSGSNLPFSIDAGYTQKGTDQYRNTTNYRLAGAVAYRIATADGNDDYTVSVSGGVNVNICGSLILFGTGSGGPDASLPGTMGQATDNSADTTAVIPAMTLEDYAENNILVSYCVLGASVRPELVVPTGFMEAARGGATSVSGYHAVKMNGGADPATHNWTTALNFLSLGFQFAVGNVLVGSLASTQVIFVGPPI